MSLRKKVGLKRLNPGAVLENGATLEGGAVSSLIRRHFLNLWKWHQNSATGGAELRTWNRSRSGAVLAPILFSLVTWCYRHGYHNVNGFDTFWWIDRGLMVWDRVCEAQWMYTQIRVEEGTPGHLLPIQPDSPGLLKVPGNHNFLTDIHRQLKFPTGFSPIHTLNRNFLLESVLFIQRIQTFQLNLLEMVACSL